MVCLEVFFLVLSIPSRLESCITTNIVSSTSLAFCLVSQSQGEYSSHIIVGMGHEMQHENRHARIQKHVRPNRGKPQLSLAFLSFSVNRILVSSKMDWH